jgi:hypothetical protein
MKIRSSPVFIEISSLDMDCFLIFRVTDFTLMQIEIQFLLDINLLFIYLVGCYQETYSTA